MYEKESHLDACCHPKKSFAPGELITISTYPVNVLRAAFDFVQDDKT